MNGNRNCPAFDLHRHRDTVHNGPCPATGTLDKPVPTAYAATACSLDARFPMVCERDHQSRAGLWRIGALPVSRKKGRGCLAAAPSLARARNAFARSNYLLMLHGIQLSDLTVPHILRPGKLQRNRRQIFLAR